MTASMSGLRFECQPACTACCQRKGFVYLTEGDIARVVKFLGTTAAVFEKRYIYRTKNLRRLRMLRGPVSARGGVRDSSGKTHAMPHLFRWPELAESGRKWRRTAAWCPGIGKGELVRIETVRTLAREMAAAYPSMYP